MSGMPETGRRGLSPLGARQIFIRFLLVHQSCTRGELIEWSQVSQSNASKQVAALLDMGLLQKVSEKVPTSFRPVERLSLHPEAATVLVIYLEPRGVFVEAVRASEEPIADAFFPAKPNQADLLHALNEALNWGRPYQPDFATAIVPGGIGPEFNIVFTVDGVPRWEPLIPLESVESPLECRQITSTPTVARLIGFCRQVQSDRKIAYIHYHKGNFRPAAIAEGIVYHGKYGTAGSFVHRTVTRNRRRCICGRTGCLSDLLEAREVTAQHLLPLLEDHITSSGLDYLVLDSDLPTSVLRSLRKSLSVELVTDVDSESLLRRGARLLALSHHFQYRIHKETRLEMEA